MRLRSTNNQALGLQAYAWIMISGGRRQRVCRVKLSYGGVLAVLVPVEPILDDSNNYQITHGTFRPEDFCRLQPERSRCTSRAARL